MRYLNLGIVSSEQSQAVYHALAEAAHPGDPPTLVTVSPERPYVCVGYHQVASREIDRAYCEARGIPVGRRMVGGGAVWLDRDQIFWHLILPGVHGPVDALYERFLAAPVNAYRKMGIDAHRRPVNDIVVGARKIGGTGASTIGDVTVIVGSLMMDFDTAAMARVLKVPSEKFRDKMVAGLNDYMTTVRRELGSRAPSRETATKILVDEFSAVLGEPLVPGTLSFEEDELTCRYARRLFDPDFVYRNEGWIRPGVKIREGVRLMEGVHKAPGGLIRIIWRDREGLIDDVVLSGDFFVEPADGLERLGRRLVGLPADPGQVADALAAGWQEIRVPGVTVEDVVRAMAAGMTMVPE